jgi:hypothetical protein
VKKKPESSEIEVGPKITRAEYNEWRNYIYAIDLAKLKAVSKEKDILLQSKDIEISALKRAMMSRDLSELQESCARDKKSYEKYRDDLGQRIGINMDGAVIDPVTLEVKHIDQKENK